MTDSALWMNYHKQIRKTGGLSDTQFQDAVDNYYNEYIHKPKEIPIKVWLNAGKNDDGTSDLKIITLLKSSQNKVILLHRYPYIFKLLTSMYLPVFTAYKVLENNVDGSVKIDIRDDSGKLISPTILSKYHAETVLVGAAQNKIFLTVI